MLKRMKRRARVYQIMTIVFVCMAFLGLLIFMGNVDAIRSRIEYYQACIALVSLIGAAGSLFLQMVESRKLQQAEFVMHLNQTFVENPDYAYVYTQLEREAGTDTSGKPEPISRIQLSNYLTFFESMYLLVSEGALQMKILNDLFGYRFFLAVHSKKVQDSKLVAQPMNFKNIYYLEKVWMDYRAENHLSTYGYDNRLEAACRAAGKGEQYEAIMKTMPGISGSRKKYAFRESFLHNYRVEICDKPDMSKVYRLYRQMQKEYPDNPFFRQLSQYMLEQYVTTQSGLVVGVFEGKKLIGASIIDYSEDICREYGKNHNGDANCAWLTEPFAVARLVMVDRAYRGIGLQQAMMIYCERYLASCRGIKHLLVALLADDIYSLRNIKFDLNYEKAAFSATVGEHSCDLYHKNIADSYQAFCRMIAEKVKAGRREALIPQKRLETDYFCGSRHCCVIGDLLEYGEEKDRKYAVISGCEDDGKSACVWVAQGTENTVFVSRKIEFESDTRLRFAKEKQEYKYRILICGR